MRSRLIRITAALAGLLILNGCTSSQVILTATAAITAEIGIATAEHSTIGVQIGDVGLSALSCIGTEYASADSAAIKATKISACATAAYASMSTTDPQGQAIAVAVEAALNTVLAAYGVTPVTSAMEARARTQGVVVAPVKLKDGAPGYFDRHQALNAAKKALAARK